MDFLRHNAIADMYGPTFLLVYFILIVATIGICVCAVRLADKTGNLRIPPIPSQPNPYEIAYLRGSEPEVIRLAAFCLIQSGDLQLLPATGRSTAQQLVAASPPQNSPEISPIEAALLSYCSTPKYPNQMFLLNLVAQVTPLCAPYKTSLEEKELLKTPEIERARRTILRIGLNIIFFTGFYKLIAALSNGYSNVGFLIFMGLAGMIVLVFASKPRRITDLGREYLKRLQQAFGRFRNVRTIQSTEMGAIDPILLGVGLFGIGSLNGSEYAHYPTMFQRAASMGGSCGSSSGCGSSSSCGSSGGGGSCGGGGGDGVGGCGGGGGD
jgi:uncharacterized protein (TIGR04222 family)